MQRKLSSVRLGVDVYERADRLVPRVAKDPGLLRVRMSRSLVIQLAIDRGLAVLEQEAAAREALAPGASRAYFASKP